jgi:hypothetical protein
MQKVLISMPDSILSRLRAIVPDRQRSKFISSVVEKELKKREQNLFKCAQKVEQDKELNADMKNWDVTLNDGLEHESW